MGLHRNALTHLSLGFARLSRLEAGRAAAVPDQSVSLPQNARAPVKLRQRRRLAIEKFRAKRNHIAHRERSDTAGTQFVAHAADIAEHVPERQPEAAITARKTKEKQNDDRQRLDEQQECHPRGAPITVNHIAVMKTNQRGGENCADETRVEPRAEHLRKKEAAQTEKPSEKHHDLKVG